MRYAEVLNEVEERSDTFDVRAALVDGRLKRERIGRHRELRDRSGMDRKAAGGSDTRRVEVVYRLRALHRRSSDFAVDACRR
jgi:hypothetical protein